MICKKGALFNMERKARVAGKFYPEDPGELLRELESLWPKPAPALIPCLGALVPHAGYVYSGKVAAQVYARLPQHPVYVLLGPNHTGRGAAVAVAGEGHWETPLGPVRINGSWAHEFLSRCPDATWDDRAHQDEHALEVQLPFLQKSGHEFSVLCITLGTWNLRVLAGVGQALSQIMLASPGQALLLASSDMNHFEDVETTRRLDRLALERVEALDPEGLMEVVAREDISMCGAGPAAAMLVAARALGARHTERVAYATSAEVSGDTRRVVGYAGVIVH
jgi:AmmeMemoRadiSam system protein B